MAPFGTLVGLFGNNLLPVFLIAGAGYLLAARFRLDPRPLAHVVFWVLAPSLIFRIIVTTEAPREDLLRLVGFAVAALVGLALVAALIGRGLGWSRTVTSAAVLVVLLPNAGNVGLAANQFAFGEDGLTYASVFFVTASVLTFTVGIFVASLGRATVGAALGGLLKVPNVWAVALAFAVAQFDWRVPTPLDRSIELLAAACIPVFLLILGMQLRVSGLSGPRGALGLTVGLRLVGGAAVGFLLAGPFGLEGVVRQSAILQSAMPSAVVTTILASEYGCEPGFVTSAVFVSTVVSPLTLTPLLAILGA